MHAGSRISDTEISGTTEAIHLENTIGITGLPTTESSATSGLPIARTRAHTEVYDTTGISTTSGPSPAPGVFKTPGVTAERIPTAGVPAPRCFGDPGNPTDPGISVST